MQTYGIIPNQLQEIKQLKKAKFLLEDSVYIKPKNKNLFTCLKANKESDEEQIEERDWMDQFVINNNNVLYLIFHRSIIMLKVFSSIMYAYMSTFRYEG